MIPPVMEKVAQKILSENDRIAGTLRRAFLERGILCVNLISSPGSGKTMLLEKTLEGLPGSERVARRAPSFSRVGRTV